jgi:chemosensory pili system protein ChpA (sensor histidine kinase/response regulator)
MIIPNEIASALEAEVAAIVDVLLECFSDPDALADANAVTAGINRYVGHVEQIGMVAEQGGLSGFSQACSQLSQRLMLLGDGEKAFTDTHRELLEEWPALIMGYMEQADSVASESLVNYLQNPAWPEPLFEVDFAELQAQLVNIPLRPTEDSAADLERVESVAEVAVNQAPDTEVSKPFEAVVQEHEDEEIPPSSPLLVEAPQKQPALKPPVNQYVQEPDFIEIRRFPHVSTLESAESLRSSTFAEMSEDEDVAKTPVVAAHAATELASPLEPAIEAGKFAPSLEPATVSVDSMPVERISEVEVDEGYASDDLALEIPLEAVTDELAEPETALVTDEAVKLDDAVGTASISEADGEIQRILESSDAEVLEPEPILSQSVDINALDQEAAIPHAGVADVIQSDVTEWLEPKADIERAEESLEDEEIEGEEIEDEAAVALEDTATLLPGFDQELVELLQTEVDLIAEATDEIKVVGLAADADTEARTETMTAYAEQIARLADAADALGLSGLQQACIHWSDNVMALASGFRLLTAAECDLLVVMPERARRYLEKLPDRPASQALIESLQKPDWPNPLPTDMAEALVELLAAPTFAVPEEMAVEARPREALPEHVSLRLPEDVNPELLDSLLQELPGQAAEFSVAIQRLATGDGVLRDVEVAQRIAHTVKGAGNTVGVRGIANLTHHIEDILQAFSKHQALPGRRLADSLLSAADCLESMSESLVGLGEPPQQAQEVLQNILDWANQIDQDGLPQDDKAPVREFAPKSSATQPLPLEEMAEVGEGGETAAMGAAGPQTAVPMLRVPATLVDDLLRLVGESIILTGQVQERARKAFRQIRAVQTQHQVFQQLTADLEQLVEIRGIAPLPGQQLAGVGTFDPLELEQYNELNTVTHRLLEASADSRALGQDIREDLSALDDLLVTQGRLHRQSQEAVLRTRMVPVKTIVPRLQRSVRQTCRLTDKEVQFVVTGGETWMDSQLLADITDPLMHVLRNAIDHGIEPSTQRQAAGKARRW